MEAILQSLMHYLISLPAIIIGLTFHEYAHGRMALYLGDKTAYYAGRLTLNPLPHLDPVGFLMLLFFHFGWAKPVPVNPYQFDQKYSQKTGMLLVALAGPAMNFLLAAVTMLLLRIFAPFLSSPAGQTALQILLPCVTVNLVLAIFNLIPIPPLDGSKILAGLLPESGYQFMQKLERLGPVLLLVFVLSDAAGYIISPGVNAAYQFLYRLIF